MHKRSKLLSLTDLEGKVLVHIKSIFYESTLTFKCEIIRTLRILVTNLVRWVVCYFLISLFKLAIKFYNYENEHADFIVEGIINTELFIVVC